VKRPLKIGLIVVAVILGVGLWFWHEYTTRPIKPDLEAKLNKLVRKFPELKPMHEKAKSDGVITLREAKEMVDRVKHKVKKPG